MSASPLALLLCLVPAAPAAAPPAAEQPTAPVSRAAMSAAEGLRGAVAEALERSPRVQAARARWQAASEAVAPSRRLPDPMVAAGAMFGLSGGGGLQQTRLGLEQELPWPTTLSASGDAAEAEARAAHAELQATTLGVARAVHEAWWDLWELRAERTTHRAHLVVLDGLSAALRARVAVGGATLADLQQVDLARARLADRVASLDAGEPPAEVALAAAIGEVGASAGPVADPGPRPQVPALDDAALRERVLAQPALAAATARVEASQAALRGARGRRLPGFAVGLEWQQEGPASMTGAAGHDSLGLGLGVRLPLWQRAAAAEVRAARARQDAAEAERHALALDLDALRVAEASRVRDTARRIALLEGTLLPQADAAYASLLASYAAGTGSVAQVLLVQGELLDLRVDLDRVRAEHARAWAALDQLAGGPVERRPPEDG